MIEANNPVDADAFPKLHHLTDTIQSLAACSRMHALTTALVTISAYLPTHPNDLRVTADFYRALGVDLGQGPNWRPHIFGVLCSPHNTGKSTAIEAGKTVACEAVCTVRNLGSNAPGAFRQLDYGEDAHLIIESRIGARLPSRKERGGMDESLRIHGFMAENSPAAAAEYLKEETRQLAAAPCLSGLIELRPEDVSRCTRARIDLLDYRLLRHALWSTATHRPEDLPAAYLDPCRDYLARKQDEGLKTLWFTEEALAEHDKAAADLHVYPGPEAYRTTLPAIATRIAYLTCWFEGKEEIDKAAVRVAWSIALTSLSQVNRLMSLHAYMSDHDRLCRLLLRHLERLEYATMPLLSRSVVDRNNWYPSERQMRDALSFLESTGVVESRPGSDYHAQERQEMYENHQIVSDDRGVNAHILESKVYSLT